jgi:hypothetical protein
VREKNIDEYTIDLILSQMVMVMARGRRRTRTRKMVR